MRGMERAKRPRKKEKIINKNLYINIYIYIDVWATWADDARP